MGIIINNSGKFEDLVLMIAKRQTYIHRDRDIIQTCYSIVFLTTSVLLLLSCVVVFVIVSLALLVEHRLASDADRHKPMASTAHASRGKNRSKVAEIWRVT